MRVFFCTTPVDKADEIARRLVEDRLAACVNVLPTVRSVYRWKGEIENDVEALLVIKTHALLFKKLEARIRELHPYEVFELIGLPIEQGHQPYLDWIKAETT